MLVTFTLQTVFSSLYAQSGGKDKADAVIAFICIVIDIVLSQCLADNSISNSPVLRCVLSATSLIYLLFSLIIFQIAYSPLVGA